MSLAAQQPLSIEDLSGPRPGQPVLRLKGPMVLETLFQFQSTLRAKDAKALIIDFTGVPYVDSAGIGALVGAHVTHHKDGRSLALVGVNDRVRIAPDRDAGGAIFPVLPQPHRSRAGLNFSLQEWRRAHRQRCLTAPFGSVGMS